MGARSHSVADGGQEGHRGGPAMIEGPSTDPTPRTVTVVVCAYTMDRWGRLLDAVASLQAQRRPPDQVLLVVDHNDELLQRARASLPGSVDVVPNTERQGLSGARNSGVRLARGDVVAFLDDDAEADPDWLEALLAQYRPGVAGVGGVARPVWPGSGRPRWFPAEFDWVVGCSYAGLPDTVAQQRNLIGAAMSFRRSAFDLAGSFDTEMGRVGSLPLGCEETEFAIRVGQVLAGTRLLHVPDARVDHHVTAERTTFGYFLRRCYAEGISKAAVARRTGRDRALATERSYVLATLPRGVHDGLRAGLRGDPGGFGRAAAICVGLVATGIGYLAGSFGR